MVMYKNLLRMSRRLARPRALGHVLGKLGGLSISTLTPAAPSAPPSRGAMIEETAFGLNPGGLRMFLYVPAVAPKPLAPLIVVLHGCGQHAQSFASDAGWIAVADRLGVPLLLPEQVGGNNAGRCFNWFLQGDTRRDAGEAGSIRQMVAAAVARFQSDPGRVFVAGLSAGGAMAAAMLAAYPEVFAAGAVVAGLPVGAAGSPSAAFASMAGHGPHHSAAEWAELARVAGPPGFPGAWPRVSIWQGGADHTVAPSNAGHLVSQWRVLHKLDATPTTDTRPVAGARRQSWGNGIEMWTLDAMGHGFPTDRLSQDRFCPDVGVDAATAIARFWQLPVPA